MSSWSFITNYGTVLSLISQHPKMTTRELALQIGITERSVHRIITDLEAEGYIQKVREGRQNRYEVNPELSLRSSSSRNTTVRELIKILALSDASETATASSQPGLEVRYDHQDLTPPSQIDLTPKPA